MATIIKWFTCIQSEPSEMTYHAVFAYILLNNLVRRSPLKETHVNWHCPMSCFWNIPIKIVLQQKHTPSALLCYQQWLHFCQLSGLQKLGLNCSKFQLHCQHTASVGCIVKNTALSVYSQCEEGSGFQLGGQQRTWPSPWSRWVSEARSI